MSLENIKKTLDEVEKLYTENFQSYGCTSKSVGWKDQESQYLRFQKLAQIISVDKNDCEITVNDWGCGYGAMFKYLDALPSIKLLNYYGYDISKKMLSATEKYINDERAEWIDSQHIIHEADYSFVSGTFNIRFEANDKLWTKYIEETLMQLAKMSKQGFAFNLLSMYVDWKEEHLYYGDRSASG